MNDYLETRELYHFGIKGQKWGVRRFQNEDGTLTNAGKKRLSSASKALDNASKASNTAANMFTKQKGSKRINKKDYSLLSDDELRKRVNRLSLERQYGDLSGDTKYVKSGIEKTHEVLQTIGAILGIASSAVLVAQGIDAFRSSK